MTEQVHNMLAMWAPGPFELIVILIIAVLIFGRRLPEIARGVGKSLTEFKKGAREAQNEVNREIDRAADAEETLRAGSKTETKSETPAEPAPEPEDEML